jgi:hypothetical protein
MSTANNRVGNPTKMRSNRLIDFEVNLDFNHCLSAMRLLMMGVDYYTKILNPIINLDKEVYFIGRIQKNDLILSPLSSKHTFFKYRCCGSQK